MNYNLRKALVQDIKEIAALERICFSEPWSEESFITDIRYNGIAIYIVAEWEKKIIAYAGLWAVGDEGHITNIAVHPEKRNQGVGRKVMERLFQDAAERGVCRYTLEVRVTNFSALHLYRSMGFVEVGRRKGYYRDTGEDALILWREIY